MYFKDAIKKCEDLKIRRTVEELKKNHIEAFYAKTPEEAVIIFKDLVRENSVVTAGGCMTSIELGIVEILRSGV